MDVRAVSMPSTNGVRFAPPPSAPYQSTQHNALSPKCVIGVISTMCLLSGWWQRICVAYVAAIREWHLLRTQTKWAKARRSLLASATIVNVIAWRLLRQYREERQRIMVVCVTFNYVVIILVWEAAGRAPCVANNSLETSVLSLWLGCVFESAYWEVSVCSMLKRRAQDWCTGSFGGVFF